MVNDTNRLSLTERAKGLKWLLIVATVCYILGVWNPPNTPPFQIAMFSIGSAFIVAFILGITIDWWMRKSIINDVFKATVGYMLPDELKPEMEWVYKQDVIAMKHNQKYRIKIFKNNLVIIEVTINRTLRNISQRQVPIEPSLSIDEWFHSEKPSEILEFSWIGNKNTNCKQVKGTHTLETKCDDTNRISLAPQQEIHLWNKFTETKHINDLHTMHFIYATKDPFVDVEISDGLDISVEFASHEQHTINRVGRNAYILNGTLLPGQQILIRWWRTENSEKWLSEAPKADDVPPMQ